MSCFRIRLFSFELIVCGLLTACFGGELARESGPPDSQIRAYRLGHGEIVAIAQSQHATFHGRTFDGKSGTLHKKEDGSWRSTLGWTERPDGHTASFSRCPTGEIEFDGKKAYRIPFDVTDTVFERDGGIKLAGRLVLPK